jgi:Kdo2-lipid IVA lauroyltransferase/acyltransferase
VSTGRGLAELLIAWQTPTARLPAAEVQGLEHLESARAAGRGVLLLTAHTHPIELGVRLLAHALTEPVHALAREHNDPVLQAWIDAGRRASMGPTYLKKEVRGLIGALRAGALVAYAPDQNFNTASAFIPFFGVPAATLMQWPRLVASGNAVALSLLTVRTSAGYRLEIGPPIDAAGDPIDATRTYLARVEHIVRAHPAQYLWAHRRFKKRPDGAAPAGYPSR